MYLCHPLPLSPRWLYETWMHKKLESVQTDSTINMCLEITIKSRASWIEWLHQSGHYLFSTLGIRVYEVHEYYCCINCQYLWWCIHCTNYITVIYQARQGRRRTKFYVDFSHSSKKREKYTQLVIFQSANNCCFHYCDCKARK